MGYPISNVRASLQSASVYVDRSISLVERGKATEHTRNEIAALAIDAASRAKVELDSAAIAAGYVPPPWSRGVETPSATDTDLIRTVRDHTQAAVDQLSQGGARQMELGMLSLEGAMTGLHLALDALVERPVAPPPSYLDVNAGNFLA